MNRYSFKGYCDDDVVSSHIAATLIQRSVSWLNNDRSGGQVKIPFSKPVPGGRVVYRIGDLKAFLKSGRVEFPDSNNEEVGAEAWL